MEISSPGLSSRQRSILLALLYQMVERKELDLASCVEGQDRVAPTLREVVLRTTAGLLHQVHLRLADVNPLRVLTSAGYRVATDPVVRSYIYLSGCFSDVQVCDLYFPGVSAPQAGEDDDRPVGDLGHEFADSESCQALMTELHAWASRDPKYQPDPGNTIENVAAALRRREFLAAN